MVVALNTNQQEAKDGECRTAAGIGQVCGVGSFGQAGNRADLPGARAPMERGQAAAGKDAAVFWLAGVDGQRAAGCGGPSPADAVQRPGLLHGSPASAAGADAGGLGAGGPAGDSGSGSQS